MDTENTDRTAAPSTESQRTPAESLTHWLQALCLGDPLASRSLALVPVYQPAARPAPAYSTLERALAAGTLKVQESPAATVPTLVAHNSGALPVLIIDGDEVSGGLQNRVVNTSLLVPTGPFPLPVTCIEHHRWHGTPGSGGATDAAGGFSAGETAYPTLRRMKAQQVSLSLRVSGAPRADQMAVWDEIADRHHKTGTASRTGAMRDTYRQREPELAETERALPCPEDGPIGVIALMGGRAACADLFDHPETLRQYWPRLVRSYAMDALEVPAARPSRSSAHRLISRAVTAQSEVFRSPGLGTDVRLSGSGVAGSSLVHEGVAVHTALFRVRGSQTAERPTRIGAARARERQNRQDRRIL